MYLITGVGAACLTAGAGEIYPSTGANAAYKVGAGESQAHSMCRTAQQALQELEQDRSRQTLEQSAPSQALVRQAPSKGKSDSVLHWSGVTDLGLFQLVRDTIENHDDTCRGHCGYRSHKVAVLHRSSLLYGCTQTHLPFLQNV